MILISVQSVAKSFGVHQVLGDVSFSLQKGEKMGLVGVNGSGKTTLMRLISGQEQPDGGAIHLGKGLRIGYLAQLGDLDPGQTVWETVRAVFAPVIALQERLGEVEKEMEAAGNHPQEALRLAAEYQRLTERFDQLEGYAYEGEMLWVLSVWAFPAFHERKTPPSPAGSAPGCPGRCCCKARRAADGRSTNHGTWRPSSGSRIT